MTDHELVRLEAEARYARESYQLYRARAYGSQLTGESRLRQLALNSQLADRRLESAKSARIGEDDAKA